jgi:hypothetical protein
MRIDVTWLTTMEGEVVGAKSATGIRNINLRSSQLAKMKKIRLNQSLMYKDLRQTVQRVPLILCKRLTGLDSAPRKTRVFHFSALAQPKQPFRNYF